jgi:hypothetical protein
MWQSRRREGLRSVLFKRMVIRGQKPLQKRRERKGEQSKHSSNLEDGLMPHPHIITADPAKPATPLALVERPFDENWLQEVLFRYPAILPVDEIEPGYGPLISLCREMNTASGYVDNLFINHRGQLTLAECKLWRNSEARRKVVAQLLDYAKDLTGWGLNELTLNARTANKALPSDLHTLVAQHPEALSPTLWADAVSRNLRLGKMLLLIVGDGIREETANLTAFLQSYAHLSFTLGLVEMPVYRFESDWVLAPRVALKTQIINRVVVQTGKAPSDSEHEDADDEEEAATVDAETAAQQQANLTFWTDFLSRIPDVRQDLVQPTNPGTGQTLWLRIFPPPMPAWIGVFNSKGFTGGGVYVGFCGPKSSLFALGRRMYEFLLQRRDDIEKALGGAKLEWVIRAEQPSIIWRLPPSSGRTSAETAAWLVERAPQFMQVMRPALFSARQEAEGGTAS